MKIAITGHAGGLGASIASTFEEHGHTIQGFSIPEYDVSDHKTQKLIVQESMDADVFVNCAYNRETENGPLYKGIEQVQLFAAMYYHWKKEDKHIVNISSIAPTHMPDTYDPYSTAYTASKAALDYASDQAAILHNRCRVTNIRPDWIDSNITDWMKKERNMKFDSILKYEDVADLVYQAVRLSEVMTITSISFKGTVT
jgi:NAD(P)-dependent dehydrogenase (short-subunit alcohol dehydrogenase family)